MSIAPGLELSYNTACPACGLAGWEHEDDCPNVEPPSCPDAIGSTTRESERDPTESTGARER